MEVQIHLINGHDIFKKPLLQCLCDFLILASISVFGNHKLWHSHIRWILKQIQILNFTISSIFPTISFPISFNSFPRTKDFVRICFWKKLLSHSLKVECEKFEQIY